MRIVDKLSGRKPNFVIARIYNPKDTTFVTGFSSNHAGFFSCTLNSVPVGKEYLKKVEAIPIRVNDDEEVKKMKDRRGDYEPLWIPLKVPDTDEKFIMLPDAKMVRPWHKLKTTTLKELTVTASRVKFYHKRDTLIYNADAFLLPEGSMLDALVAQLPGVVLKEDGRIFCNGRFVEELLLNGRDLFNGDRMLMLENLAAYTVKDIAVYDKRGPNSELAGHDVGDTRHVMDVRLKREYSSGWIVNAEAGEGTRKRYLGRLFALWYSDNASISAYAGANNLNDTSVPGKEEGSWTPSSVGNGVSENQKGGLVYTAVGPKNIWSLKGDLKFERSDNTDSNESRSVNYLSSGDTYSYGWSNFLNRSWSLTSSHAFRLKVANKMNLTVSPSFSYGYNKSGSDFSEGTFSSEIPDMDRKTLADLYFSGTEALESVINRNLREAMTKGTSTGAGIGISAFMPVRYRSEDDRAYLTVNAGYSYGNRNRRSFDRYMINYGNDSHGSFGSQFTDGSPEVSNSASASLDFRHITSPRFTYTLRYSFSYSYFRKTSLLYRLDRIEGFDSMDTPIGTLPSMREYEPCMDPNLSFLSRLGEVSNRISPELRYTVNPDNGIWMEMMLSAPLELRSRNYEYVRPGLGESTRLKPLSFIPRGNFNIIFRYTPADRWNLQARALVNVTPFLPNLHDMIDVRNDADPLNVFTGNPDLKNALQINCNANWNLWKSTSPFGHNFYVTFNTILDQFARGFLYDRSTGVRTFRTYNVDGNRNLSAGYDLSFGFGKNRCLQLSSNSSGRFRNSVDLVGTELTESGIPPKQTVRTSELYENLSLSWTRGRTRVTGFGRINWSRYSSPDASIANRHSLTFGYGVSAFANLPKGWGISSDISLYGRRGFDDQRLNSSDLIWNARITKTLLKGQLLIVLDGYDILHQLSSISYSVNAQAKTETISNVIPNYFLLHIRWRFNKKPKKRF